jgi:hypothetical protein
MDCSWAQGQYNRYLGDKMAKINSINNASYALTSDTTLTATLGNITATAGDLIIGNVGAALTSGDLVGTIKFSGHDGTQYTDGAKITSTSSGTIANTRVAGDLKFYTHPDSAAADPTLRMTIAAAGNITIAAPDAGVGLTVTAGGITATAGHISLTAGNLYLSECTYATGGNQGIIYKKNFWNGSAWISVPWIHDFSHNPVNNYASANVFIGTYCGNLTMGNSARFNIGIGSVNDNANQGTLIGLTQGINNLALGYNNSNLITTGSFNVSLGTRALAKLTTGNNNLCIASSWGGYDGAGYAYTSSESNNVCLQSQGIIGESNKLRLGTTGSGVGQQNDCWIAGTYAPATAIGGTAKVMLVDSADHTGGLAGAANTVLQGGTAPTFAAIDLSTAIVSSTLPPARGGRNTVSESTTSNAVQMAINTTYIATSTDGATLVVYTLPATAAVGDTVKVIGKSTAFWKVAQNATDTIFYGAATSTPGNTGYATTAQIYASATFTCITASSIWSITEFAGTVTLV